VVGLVLIVGQLVPTGAGGRQGAARRALGTGIEVRSTNPCTRCAPQLVAAPVSSWPARSSWRSGAAAAARLRQEVVDLVLIVGQLVRTGAGGPQGRTRSALAPASRHD
jgi:hypothetical protein